MVVNAAGPWVRDVLDTSDLNPQVKPLPDVRLVKGSHIIVSKRYEGEQAYITQQEDGRIVFVIPYEGKYTLIGTTEENYDGDPYDAMISDDEMSYLLNAYNSNFDDEITVNDAIWSYSGVRPLFDDGEEETRAVTRDYVLHHHLESRAPMISIFGGKLTTYRVLSEEVVDELLLRTNGNLPAWTARKPLPGGDLEAFDFAGFLTQQGEKYPWIPEALLLRYARAYGTLMDRFLGDAQSLRDLGIHYGDDVYEAEIVYLLKYEWAREVEDVLWRRSKLGVHVSDETVQAIEKALPGLKKKVLS